MKLTRIAILLILAAAGCRLAVTQKDAAARRLTEMLLTRLVSLQTAPPVARTASAISITAATPKASTGEQASAVAEQQPENAQRWSTRTLVTNAQCPNALRTAVAAQRVVRTTRPAGHSGFVWVRLVVPDALSCERAKLSGS